jgi:hypothetical protein
MIRWNKPFAARLLVVLATIAAFAVAAGAGMRWN